MLGLANFERAYMRVMIAQDVLLSIGKIVPVVGVYLNRDHKPTTSPNDSRAFAEECKQDCEVCALGAMFLSAVSIHNEFDFVGNAFTHGNGLDDSFGLRTDKIKDRLNSFFDRKQMAMIEAAFEREIDFMAAYGDYDEGRKCSRFASDLAAESRLKKIMNNIIVNQGEFKP